VLAVRLVAVVMPRLLDLFCGAGGCSEGYRRAGFEVVGVDINPQPNYPFKFWRSDALRFLQLDPPQDIASNFDAIHASPPCQAYSSLSGFTTKKYPELIEPVRELLQATGLPYVIENVVGAPLIDPVRLCGSSFGLGVWRHRLFEMSHPPALVPPCSHREHPEPLDVTGTGGPPSKPRLDGGGGSSRKPRNLAQAREAMGIDWMTREELSESIPPAYTEFIGNQLMERLTAEAA
jgi:DNA (cytosine-5)-methyltransferase 1